MVGALRKDWQMITMATSKWQHIGGNQSNRNHIAFKLKQLLAAYTVAFRLYLHIQATLELQITEDSSSTQRAAHPTNSLAQATNSPSRAE